MKPSCWVRKVSLAVCISGAVLFVANRASADPIVPTYNHTYASFTDLRMSISAPTSTACRQAGCSAFDASLLAAHNAEFTLAPRVRGKDYRPAFATVGLVSGLKDTDADKDDPSPVPEPATLALPATGLVGLGLKTTRRRRKSS